jgi:hypothetical protein
MAKLRLRMVAAMVCAPALIGPALASEGGVSFWLPGNFGSLAATPGVPGLAFATVYYHTSVSAGAGVQVPRGGQVDVGLKGDGNLLLFGPTYTFAQPVWGGQFAIGLLGFGGRNAASVNATLTGPNGQSISGQRSEALTSFGDVIPEATLKWNQGVNNYMLYVMGDVPVGNYNPNRLANLGLGHGAIDGGAGYTYLNPQTGHELSIVTGLTYNFKNPDTQYQNGIDWHVDWGASQFISKQVHIGLVGYYFQQLTGDSGAGATLGPFKSRIAGIGPQIGYIFPINAATQGYLNLKAYWEFAAQNRPDGWNMWLTFAVSPAEPKTASR